MRLKALLIILIITACLFNRALFAQTASKHQKVTINFDIKKVYDRLLYYASDTVLIAGAPKDSDKIIFANGANFDSAIFLNAANFRGVRFENPSNFNFAVFQDIVVFSNSEFENINFGNSNFTKTADFSNTIFDGNAGFRASKFQKKADFDGSLFQDTVDFNHSFFSNIANFNNLRVRGSTIFEFNDSSLPLLISFANNPGLNYTVDFCKTDFSRPNRYLDSFHPLHYINLNNSDISKIKIDYQHFRLCFYSADKKISDDLGGKFYSKGGYFVYKNVNYTVENYQQLLESDSIKSYLKKIFPFTEPRDPVRQTFLINCLEVQEFPAPLSKEDIISTYENILKTFEINGQKLSYETLDVEYCDYKYPGWRRPLHLWNRYGYSKWLILPWSLGLIWFFTFINFFLLDILNGKNEMEPVNYLSNTPAVSIEKTRWRLFRRFWYFLIYTPSAVIFFLLDILNGKSKMEAVNHLSNISVVSIKETHWWLFRRFWYSLMYTLTSVMFFVLGKRNGKNEMEPVYHLPNIPVVSMKERHLWSMKETYWWLCKRFWYSLMYTSTIFFLLTLKVDKLNFKKPLVAYVLLVYAIGILCLGYIANFVLQK